jgi:hypothetical protein
VLLKYFCFISGGGGELLLVIKIFLFYIRGELLGGINKFLFYIRGITSC